MHIYIEGREAYIKAGSSFDFVQENSAMTDADGYSLTITFPIRGCSENIAIFGHINRPDFDIDKVRYPCEILNKGMSMHGVLTLTDANELEVKAQFLTGRSAQNSSLDFSEIYISDLHLGTPDEDRAMITNLEPLETELSRTDYVAFPWKSIIEGEDQIQNRLVYYEGIWMRGIDLGRRSFQPYLLFITKLICDNLGYAYDFSEWENSPYKQLLICNTLPADWYGAGFQWQMALPRWSVEEYFHQLEYLLGGRMDIDHLNKSITFSPHKKADALPKITINDVVNEYTVNVSQEEQNSYLKDNNYEYEDCDYEKWKYMSCAWLLRDRYVRYRIRTEVYPTIDQLMDYMRLMICVYPGTGANMEALDKLYYAKDVDTYFALIRTGETGRDGSNEFEYTQPVALNQFGGKLDGKDSTEIKFAPALLDVYDDDRFLNHGLCIYLPLNSDFVPNETQKIPIEELIDAGEKDKDNVYFDRIYLAFYDGEAHVTSQFCPCPSVDSFRIARRALYDYRNTPEDFNPLRLNQRKPILDISRESLRKKYVFDFLAAEIPDVKSIFYIRGKRYVCERITAKFTDEGMSERMRGEFYRLD